MKKLVSILSTPTLFRKRPPIGCATRTIVEHGVPVVIARIFNCYGPRETEPYVIPEIIAQLYRGPCIALGNINAERDLLSCMTLLMLLFQCSHRMCQTEKR